MGRRRKINPVMGFIGASVLTGVGGAVTGKLGTVGGVTASTGIARFSTYLPTTGTVLGAGMVLKQLKKLRR